MSTSLIEQETLWEFIHPDAHDIQEFIFVVSQCYRHAFEEKIEPGEFINQHATNLGWTLDEFNFYIPQFISLRAYHLNDLNECFNYDLIREEIQDALDSQDIERPADFLTHEILSQQDACYPDLIESFHPWAYNDIVHAVHRLRLHTKIEDETYYCPKGEVW